MYSHRVCSPTELSLRQRAFPQQIAEDWYWPRSSRPAEMLGGLLLAGSRLSACIFLDVGLHRRPVFDWKLFQTLSTTVKQDPPALRVRRASAYRFEY